MAKKGMARPEWTHQQPRNDVPPRSGTAGEGQTGQGAGKARDSRHQRPGYEGVPQTQGGMAPWGTRSPEALG